MSRVPPGHFFTLILLDIMLPGEDGLAILQKLRQSQETASYGAVSE